MNKYAGTSFLILQHHRKVRHTRYKASRIKEERYVFDYARTDSQRSQAFALRYQVFCLERNFIPHHFYPDQQQTDEFDFQKFTDHLIGFYAETTDSISGTMRIIRDPKNPSFSSDNPSISARKAEALPMEAHYPLEGFRKRGRNIEQVTSLAFTKGIKEQMYFGLCKGIYLDAIHHQIDDIFIQANPLMAWLFEAIGFKPLYSTHHAISAGHNASAHHEIPVIGMHLDMNKITSEFLQYFMLPDKHFLF